MGVVSVDMGGHRSVIVVLGGQDVGRDSALLLLVEDLEHLVAKILVLVDDQRQVFNHFGKEYQLLV